MNAATRPDNQTALPDREPPSVLVVEDSAAEQARLAIMLEKLGYRVVKAGNGAQALALLRAQPVQMILSDWAMPELSGLELCRQVRADASLGRPYFILVTGRTTSTDLVAGMDAGADDFIAKPYHAEELRVRVQAGMRVVEHQAACTLPGSAPVSEVDAIAAMQRALQPDGRSPFPQLELASLMQQAGPLAGDAFDCFELDEQHLGFFHAAIPGGDVAAAMQAVRVHRHLSPVHNAATRRAAGAPSGRIVPPEEVVAGLSRQFLSNGDCCREFTLVYGVLNVATGAGRICQAAHPEPLLVSAGGQVRRFASGGYPIGKDAEAMYQGQDFQLEPGDRLFVLSPGIEACRDPEGRPFGIHLLATLLVNSNRSALPLAIKVVDDLIANWHDGAGLSVDISALAISRKAD